MNREADDRARAAQGAEALVGRMVGGKYRVERILGRGGMGTIYVAVQQPLGRRVALKVLHPTLGDSDADPEFQKRFLLEAATLSRLAHPNIVVVHDYGSLAEEHGACFMAMELLEGKTINQALHEEGGGFEVSRALRITRDIARALRVAHDQGVVHRDLKPSNVMLCHGLEGEAVKVLDFGLVKVMRDDSEELTAEGRFLGSPRYMSPEQIQRLPMDGRSDLYSLGVILYRMLAGVVPFAGDHAVQTLVAHLSQEPPPLSSHEGVQVPAAVEQLVMKLLSKSPDHRFARAGELIRAIDAVWPQRAGEPVLGSSEQPSLQTSPPPLVALAPATGTYPSLSGHRADAPPAVVVPAPVAAPAVPEAPSRPRWLMPIVVLLGVGAGLGGAALVASVLHPAEPAVPEGGVREASAEETPPRHERPASAPASAAEPVTAAQPTNAAERSAELPVIAAVDGEPSPPVPASTTFSLTIRSVPLGATVEREGEELGTTPLTLPLERSALVGAPARFTLRMRGHEPITLEQGPSEADVELERELPRVAARSRGGTPSPGDQRPRSGADLSIKMAR